MVEKDKKTFGIQAKKLPTRIMAAGLGQALAFLEAKKYAPLLCDGLADWLNQRRPVTTGQATRVVERVMTGDANFLRFATAESLAYLLWLVRFADAKDLTKDAQNRRCPGVTDGTRICCEVGWPKWKLGR